MGAPVILGPDIVGIDIDGRDMGGPVTGGPGIKGTEHIDIGEMGIWACPGSAQWPDVRSGLEMAETTGAVWLDIEGGPGMVGMVTGGPGGGVC